MENIKAHEAWIFKSSLYNQRNNEGWNHIISVIKRLFVEYLTSKLITTQNSELKFLKEAIILTTL
jgi:hypothetical protein